MEKILVNKQTIDKRLVLDKTIYAKRNKTTANQLAEILNLEIHCHLQNHPDLVFLGKKQAVKNADLSLTHTLLFGYKQPEPKVNEQLQTSH